VSAVSDVLAVEFEAPDGDALRVEWDEARLAGLDPEPASEPVWRLAGELDWDEVERLRVLSARLADDRVLAIAALRPAGAAGHGEELVSAAWGVPGAAERLERALLSTEYGPDGLPRRVGLELYAAEGDLPTRIAADVTATARSTTGAVERLSAGLALRGDGGAGALDLVRLT
jgi:hypothetical protein